MKIKIKLKLNLSQKLQVYIISITLIVIISAILFISNIIKETAIENTKQYTSEVVSRYAKEIELKFNSDLSVVRTLARTLETQPLLDTNIDRPWFISVYESILIENKQFDDIWDSWEFSNIFPSWTKDHGRYVYTVINKNNNITLRKEIKSLDEDTPQYKKIKINNKEQISEPYLFSFTGNPYDKVLITDVSAPLNNEKGEYLGLVGADIRLEKIQELTNRIKPFEKSSAFLLSNEAIYTSNSNIQKIGKTAIQDFKNIDLLFKVQKGESFNYTFFDENGNEFFYIFKPVYIGKTNTPWSLCLKIPMQTIVNKATEKNEEFLLLGFLALAIISLTIAFLSRKITKPLREITKTLIILSKGEISKEIKTKYSTGDEIEDISIALNKTIDSLMDKTTFSKEIGENNLSSELKLLSKKDILGQSLINMQASLLKAKNTEDDRKTEDAKRQWANEGLAKFADIFRQNNDSIENLTSIFTSQMVKYNKANQATLFLKDNNIIKSIATFAYDRNKYNTSEINIGEGLVGTCVIEKKPIYLTDIPQGYIKITSGLGEATPSSLFLCPIQTDTKVIGVFEIAAFKEIKLYQREFIEQICTNFASVIESVRVNDKTKILLEQTQQQTEEMKAQEEEMRQNLEELQTTQEEIAVKSTEMKGVLNAIDASSLVLKLDMNGNLIEINNAFIELLKLPKEAVLGKNLKDFTNYANNNQTYEEFWNNLRKGVPQKEEQIIRLSNGKEIWLSQVFSTIFDENGKPINIMNIATDITKRKIQEAEMQQQNEEMSAQEEMMRLNMEEIEEMQNLSDKKTEEVEGFLNALNSSNFIVEYNTLGEVIEINDSYLNFLDISKTDALNMKQTDQINNKHDFWNLLLEGEIWKGNSEIIINNKLFELNEIYTPIKNKEGEVVKILKIANNIVDFKA